METERNWNGDGEREQSSLRENLEDRATSQARQAREQMRSLADAGREEVANQLEGFAKAFSTAGQNLRDEEQATVGRYTELIGEQARNASEYFRERNADALIEDTSGFARRQPLLFLGGCFVAGLAIGRFLNASPPSRYEGTDEGYGEGRFGGYEAESRALARRPETSPVGASTMGSRIVSRPGESAVETAPVREVGPRVDVTSPDEGER